MSLHGYTVCLLSKVASEGFPFVQATQGGLLHQTTAPTATYGDTKQLYLPRGTLIASLPCQLLKFVSRQATGSSLSLRLQFRAQLFFSGQLLPNQIGRQMAISKASRSLKLEADLSQRHEGVT